MDNRQEIQTSILGLLYHLHASSNTPSATYEMNGWILLPCLIESHYSYAVQYFAMQRWVVIDKTKYFVMTPSLIARIEQPSNFFAKTSCSIYPYPYQS